MSDHPFLAHRPLAIAHQGGGGENVENTQAAFDHAWALGYRHLDADVVATADAEPVLAVVHDTSLDRLYDRSGKVSELFWADVAQARTRDGDHRIERLDDLFERYPGAYWNLEAKTQETIAPLAKLVHESGTTARACGSAFRDSWARQVRHDFGQLGCSTLGRFNVAWLKVASWLPVPFRAYDDTVQVPVRQRGIPVDVITERFIARAHEADLAVIAWTIDDPDEMVRLLDLGVDGINTDRPTVLRSVLEERGQWSPRE